MAETPKRTVRIDDETWAEAMAQAREEGIDASDMVREGLHLRIHPVSVDAELALIIMRLKQLRKRLKGEL